MIKYRNCEFDVNNFCQSKLTEVDYKLGNIEAYSNIGNIRKTQEDSLYIDSKNGISVLAVADGMGGEESGELASYLCVNSLYKWFNSFDLSNFSDVYILKDIKEKLSEIDELIRKNCGKGGTTLTLSLVLNDSTLILNVGDSRTYIYNGSLIQITEDDSRAFRAYKNGTIPTKDDIRFYKENNFISSKLGGIKCNMRIFDYKIDNDYKYLLQFSDGVTDILSDYDISRIIKNNTEDIARKIVAKSLVKSDYCLLDKELFNNRTSPGKDNSTAIVLRR